jgi:hypothetical protein
MAFRKRNYRKASWRKTTGVRARVATMRRRKAPARRGFAASPAGRHRTLALNCFKIARRARTAGNYAHYWKMLGFGKRALALAKSEVRMWKRGAALRARSFATHRKARAGARA